MEKDLKIAATNFTPLVDLNSENGILSFSGKCMPEDIGGYFDPIFKWVRSYVQNPNNTTELRIFFEYYNSSTARKMTEMIFELEQILNKGKSVKVIWYYNSGDIIMKENGEEIKSVIEIPFELVEK